MSGRPGQITSAQISSGRQVRSFKSGKSGQVVQVSSAQVWSRQVMAVQVGQVRLGLFGQFRSSRLCQVRSGISRSV